MYGSRTVFKPIMGFGVLLLKMKIYFQVNMGVLMNEQYNDQMVDICHFHGVL